MLDRRDQANLAEKRSIFQTDADQIAVEVARRQHDTEIIEHRLTFGGLGRLETTAKIQRLLRVLATSTRRMSLFTAFSPLNRDVKGFDMNGCVGVSIVVSSLMIVPALVAAPAARSRRPAGAL